MEILPLEWREKLLVAFFEGIGDKKPATGLKMLLELRDILDGAINNLATSHENGIHPKHRLIGYHDFFALRVSDTSTVLDIGCGIGVLAFELSRKTGARVLGIDLNADSIQFARSRFQSGLVEFVVGDALEHLPAGDFDVVVLSNVLEHIEKRVAFLSKIRNKIRPKKVLIRVPLLEREWQVAQKRELGMFFFSDHTHFTEYTVDSFAQEVQAGGLKIQYQEIRWGEIWAELVPQEILN